MKNNDNFTASFDEKSSLKSYLLLAMPQMGDPRFHQAVIFLCVHDRHGAMGMTINQPLLHVDFASILEQIDITETGNISNRLKDLPVHAGGPVEDGRGFLLHGADFRQKDTIIVDDHFHVSGTIDSLRTMIEGDAPDHMIFALGYAGWGPGQLEQELQENAWMVVPATEDLVFKTAANDLWAKAFATIGVDPAMLSASAGRA